MTTNLQAYYFNIKMAIGLLQSKLVRMKHFLWIKSLVKILLAHQAFLYYYVVYRPAGLMSLLSNL